MANIESQMQAFEESEELNKLEIEENEVKLAEFESQIEAERNEGLFFKNLGQKKLVDKEKAKGETEKIKDITNETAGLKTRRNIYLALIGLLTIGIVDSLISSSSDWRKVSILGVILVGVTSQVIYEQSVLSDTEQKQAAKSEEERELWSCIAVYLDTPSLQFVRSEACTKGNWYHICNKGNTY